MSNEVHGKSTERPDAEPTERLAEGSTTKPTERPATGSAERSTTGSIAEPTERPTTGSTTGPAARPATGSDAEPAAGPATGSAERSTTGSTAEPTERPATGSAERSATGPTTGPTTGSAARPAAERPAGRKTAAERSAARAARRSATGKSALSQAQLIELVNRAREGDSHAFSKLYNIYFNRAYYTAFKIVRDESAAEEVVQESFLRLLTNLDTLRETKRFESWFFSIVYRQSRYWIRENMTPAPTVALDTLREDSDEIPTVLDTEFLPAEALETKEDRELLLRLIDDLPDAQRIALVLHYYDELSAPEISEVLAVSAPTVNKRLYDARASLKAGFSHATRIANYQIDSQSETLVVSQLLQSEVPAKRVEQVRERTDARMAALLPTLLSTPVANKALASRAQAFLEGGRNTATGGKALAGAGKLGAQLSTKVVCLAAATVVVAAGAGVGYALHHLASRQQAAPRAAAAATSGAQQATQQAAESSPAAQQKLAARDTTSVTQPAKEATTAVATAALPAAAASVPVASSPIIILAHPTLTYAAGTAIDAARIMADCKASLQSQAGKEISVRVSGLDLIDFKTPGAYHLYLHATDSAGNQIETAVIRIQIE